MRGKADLRFMLIDSEAEEFGTPSSRHDVTTIGLNVMYAAARERVCL